MRRHHKPRHAGFGFSGIDEEGDRVAGSIRCRGVFLQHCRKGSLDCIPISNMLTMISTCIGPRLPGFAMAGVHTRGRLVHLPHIHLRLQGVTQPPFVHKAKMAHVQKVLHQARGAGGHGIGPAQKSAPASPRGRFEWRGITQNAVKGLRARACRRWGLQSNPQQPVRHFDLMGTRSMAGRRRPFRLCRNQPALATRPELPTVIGTHQMPGPARAGGHMPQRQARAPMGTGVGPGVGLTGFIAPQHHPMAQQSDRHGIHTQCGAGQHRMPQDLLQTLLKGQNRLHK